MVFKYLTTVVDRMGHRIEFQHIFNNFQLPFPPFLLLFSFKKPSGCLLELLSRVHQTLRFVRRFLYFFCSFVHCLRHSCVNVRGSLRHRWFHTRSVSIRGETFFEVPVLFRGSACCWSCIIPLENTGTRFFIGDVCFV